MAVRLSAVRAGRPLSPGRFLILFSVRGWVDLRAILRLEGLSQLKNTERFLNSAAVKWTCVMSRPESTWALLPPESSSQRNSLRLFRMLINVLIYGTPKFISVFKTWFYLQPVQSILHIRNISPLKQWIKSHLYLLQTQLRAVILKWCAARGG
jgi:hypothetical protein